MSEDLRADIDPLLVLEQSVPPTSEAVLAGLIQAYAHNPVSRAHLWPLILARLGVDAADVVDYNDTIAD